MPLTKEQRDLVLRLSKHCVVAFGENNYCSQFAWCGEHDDLVDECDSGADYDDNCCMCLESLETPGQNTDIVEKSVTLLLNAHVDMSEILNQEVSELILSYALDDIG
jgi:hypothetical protein